MRGVVILLLFIAVSPVAVSAQSDGLPAPNPFHAELGFWESRASVAESGQASTSVNQSNTGGSQDIIQLSEEGYLARSSQESFVTHGGDHHRARNVAMSSVPILGALSGVMYTSPMSVLFSSVALTDSSLLAAFSAANQEGHESAAGTSQQEDRYLMSLRGLPDEHQKREEYAGCKKRFFNQGGAGGIAPTNFEAIKYCTSGFSVGVPVVATSFQSSAGTQARPEDSVDMPNPIHVERILRQGGTGLNICDTTLNPEGLPVKKPDDCYERSVWSYIFHHVTDNEERWRREDEARYYFGNGIISDRTPAAGAGGQTDIWLALETSSRYRYVKQVDPPYQTVNFWTPNKQSSFFGFSYNGVATPLRGIDLLKAQYLQDIYGSIYALTYKMCEHANSQNTWARHPKGGGLGDSCKFWDAPIDAQWNISAAGSIAVCNETSGGDILPSAYEKMWPGRTTGLPSWGQKRFYEHYRPGASAPPLPKMHRLLANISAGSVTFSHADAMTLAHVFRLENPPGPDGNMVCENVLKTSPLGDIMAFEGPIPSTFFGFSLGSYYRPSGPSWPLVSEFIAGTDEIQVGKRQQILFEYANAAAELKALQQIETARLSLRRQVLSGHRWADIFDFGSQIVARNLPGASHTSTTTTSIKINELSSRLAEIRAALYDYYEEVKTRAKFSDQMGGKFNPAAGASSLGAF